MERFAYSKFVPKIVSIGGGTGLSTMLRGLKNYTSDITAVVSVADDGGGSGVIRDEMNIPPPGDIRNCLLALSQSEPIMERLLNYRFETGILDGQSFGNLFLAAMTGAYDGDFVTAIRNASRVLNITGKVFPVTLTDVELIATLENGDTIVGESNIGKSVHTHNSMIKKVRLRAKTDVSLPIEPLNEILDEIKNADLITLGPGSLYTSVLPNLAVSGLKEAIEESPAPVVYINNIMTQPGETDGYTAFDHVLAILDHTDDDFLDYCIVNSQRVEGELYRAPITIGDDGVEEYGTPVKMAKAISAELSVEVAEAILYADDGADEVVFDEERFKTTNIKVIRKNLVTVNNAGLIRHNTDMLANTLLDVANMNMAKDGRYVSDEGVVLYNPKRRKR